MTTIFSLEIVQARTKWNILKALKENNCQPTVLYPVKTFFRNESEIKTFSAEGKLIEFITNRPVFKKITNSSS